MTWHWGALWLCLSVGNTLGNSAIGGTVLDQIVVVVGKHAIKSSDVERDLRVTQFLNNEHLNLSLAQRRTAVQRLIDQEVIRTELAQAGNSMSINHEVDGVLEQLKKDRFSNSQDLLSKGLQEYGLTLNQLREQLQWQMTVLRFIELRFRPGVIVTDEDIRKYFEEHKAELMKKPSASRDVSESETLEMLTPEIREQIEGERINANFEEWLRQARDMVRIEFNQESLK